jgi:hypothetical protein
VNLFSALHDIYNNPTPANSSWELIDKEVKRLSKAIVKLPPHELDDVVQKTNESIFKNWLKPASLRKGVFVELSCPDANERQEELEAMFCGWLRMVIENKCKDQKRFFKRKTSRETSMETPINENSQTPEEEIASEEPGADARIQESEEQQQAKARLQKLWALAKRALTIAKDNRRERDRASLQESWEQALQRIEGAELENILGLSGLSEEDANKARDRYYTAQKRLREALLNAPSLPNARDKFTRIEISYLETFCSVVLLCCQKKKSTDVSAVRGKNSMKHTDFLKASFAMAPDTKLELITREENPSKNEGKGLSSEPMPFQLLAAFDEDAPNSSSIKTPAAFPVHSLKRWDAHTEAFYFEAEEGCIVDTAGDVEAEDNRYMLNSKDGKMAALRVCLPAGDEFFFVAENGDIEFYQKPHTQMPADLNPAQWQLQVTTPSIEELTGDATCEEWLHTAVESGLCAADAWTQTAAVGLLARFWGADNLLQKIQTGWQSPTERVVAWAKTLSSHQLNLLTQTVHAELDALYINFEELHRAVISEAPRAQDIATMIWKRRDTIESVVFILKAAGPNPAIDVALRGADQNAESQTALFDNLSIEVDEHLSAVSWQEPDAWWGALAGDIE